MQESKYKKKEKLVKASKGKGYIHLLGAEGYRKSTKTTS